MSGDHGHQPEQDVVIVGAGLAGLACAAELCARGRRPLVLEAADAVGGRVRTDLVEGYRLDRGFQVYLPAYPEASRALDHAALELCPFEPGAAVWFAGRFHTLLDPWRRPGSLLDGALARVGTLADKLRVGSMRAELSGLDPGAVFAADRPERTIAQALEARGFSRAMIDRFFRPFFGGITLDASLSASSRLMEFVFGCFARAGACVPRLGMGEIPAQLARRLPPGAVRLHARVAALAPEAGARWRVTLADGTASCAAAVVVAVEGTAAQGLLAGARTPGGASAGAVPRRTGQRWARAWRGATCVYFALEAVRPPAPLDGPLLLLNGEMTGAGCEVANVSCMSAVSPAYAPPGGGTHLVGCTVLGSPAQNDAGVVASVRATMRAWFGPQADRWRALRVCRVERALPDQSPPWYERPSLSPWLGAGLLRAGDDADLASIDGAIRSGRRAAAALLAGGDGPGSRA